MNARDRVRALEPQITEATEEPKEKIKDRLNRLAADFYYEMGYKVREGFDFTQSKHPTELMVYRMAEIAYEEFTGDRPDYAEDADE